MPKFLFRLFLSATLAATLGCSALIGQTTNTASTNAPTATSPSAVALGDIVSQTQVDTNQLEQYQNELTTDQTLQTIDEKLPDLTRQIAARNTDDEELLAAKPSLSSLQTSLASWQSLSATLTSAQKDLSQRVQELDGLLWQLGQMDDTWKATLDTANKAKAPPEIVQRIQEVRGQIASTVKAVQSNLSPLYSMQTRVASQAAQTKAGLDTVSKAMDTARVGLFKQDHPYLWEPEALSASGVGIMAQERVSFHTQVDAFNSYLREKIGTVLVQLLLFALLAMAFYWIRNSILQRVAKEPVFKKATQVFDVPLATALLLALLATHFLYPEPTPRLFSSVAGAITLIPTIIVTRRLIDPEKFFILYAMLITYLVDQVRHVVTPSGVLARFLFIAELLAVSIFLIAALRTKHLSDSSLASNRLKQFSRIYLHFAFFVFVFAGFANVWGYVQLSVLAGEGMLYSSYLAVILYAVVRILDALAICALNSPPLTALGMVRRHRDLLYKNTNTTISWLVFGAWLVVALQLFSLRDPLWQEGKNLLFTNLKWGSLTLQVGSLLAFPITIWVSFLISRFIRFCLEEEVYPHLQLSRGIPYATSTIVHYAILVLGFFVAVKAGGGDLSQFSFLAGAFGVGLGFGLQNIFNNFVSGIILLFERPIKVGDDIQIDATTMGRVERIGIRASVIMLANGSEMIVPNGNLISNPVTNWTLSNCERLIEIPVNITSKVDPQHIQQLLTSVALANQHVLKNPAPETLLATFGATLSFRVRTWIDSEEEWMKVTSELSVAINSALAKENVTLS
jgi:small-conductance mechanosensitive channel